MEMQPHIQLCQGLKALPPGFLTLFYPGKVFHDIFEQMPITPLGVPAEEAQAHLFCYWFYLYLLAGLGLQDGTCSAMFESALGL